MITKTHTNSLTEKLERDYKEALKAYRKAQTLRKAGYIFAKQLPDVLTELGWYAFSHNNDDTYYLETWVMEATKADEVINKLRLLGVYGMKPKYKGGNTWSYTCAMMIEGKELTIMIDGGSKPPQCRIEETREMTEVITYKAICPETDEEY